MSFININQTSFGHTFQSEVTFLSNSLFESDAILSSNTKLQVNGASNFVGASEFADLTAKDIIAERLIITSSTSISGVTTVNDIFVNGKLHDGDGDFGTSGQLLSSDGIDLVWIDANTTSVANANNVGVNLNSTNADQFVTFVETNNGNNPIRVDNNLKYNPSTNVLTAPSFSGNLTGTIQTAAQTNITSLGTLSSLTVNGNITQSGTNNYIRINGGLQDKDGADGTSGQVLSSTGTQVNWINVGDITAGSASEVGVTAVNTNAVHFITFVDSSSGNENIRVDNDLKYNPGTNIISSKISDISNHDTNDLSEGSSNLYFTNARADARIAAADTGDLSEGTNLYHTTARVRSSISAGGDLSYNASTGVMSVSVPSAFISGMIILWSGSIGSIPSGWVLCNGSNSTPDLRNRFVIGAGNSYAVGNTGGSANATLVSHSHTTNSTINESNSNTKSLTGSFRNEPHDSPATTGIFSETNQSFREDSDQGNNGRLISIDATHRHTTDTQGSSATNANLPPYYALCYIMKT